MGPKTDQYFHVLFGTSTVPKLARLKKKLL